MNIQSEPFDFLEMQQQLDEKSFWQETTRNNFMYAIESSFVSDVIRHWRVSDFIVNGTQVLVKWDRRLMPLTDTELKEKYGR